MRPTISACMARCPTWSTLQAERKVKLVREMLRAWDPVSTARSSGSSETSDGMRGYDGGIMSTAGNLVFQGRGNGELWVYAADTGKVLKAIQTGSHIMAAPMTYAVGGEQFVAVQAGYGGAGIAVGTDSADAAPRCNYQNTNRIIAFKLGGGAVPTPAGARSNRRSRNRRRRPRAPPASAPARSSSSRNARAATCWARTSRRTCAS